MNALDLLMQSIQQEGNARQKPALLPKRSQKPLPMGFDEDFLADESLDPSVRVDSALGAFGNETRNRIFQAERTTGLDSPNATHPNEVKALRNLLGGIESDRASGPIAMQQAEYDTQRHLNTDAMNEGFPGTNGMSPIQERNVYKRNMAQEQMRQPIQRQQMMEDGENLRQGRQINATKDIVNTQMAPSMLDAQTRERYNDAMLGGSGGGMPEGFRKMGRYGPEFSPQARPNPNPSMRALEEARDYLGAQGNANPIATWGAPTRDQQLHDQVVRNMIATSGLEADYVAQLHEILDDPTDRMLTLSQLSEKYGFDNTDPMTIQAINLLRQFGFKP
jgi:hypothetical protein